MKMRDSKDRAWRFTADLGKLKIISLELHVCFKIVMDHLKGNIFLDLMI